MNLNWMLMGIVFIFTLILVMITETYLPKGVGFLGPIAGGLIAGYLVGGNYTDGIVNGGIPVGLAGFINITGILAIKGNTITATLNGLIYNVSHIELLISVIFAGFLFYFIMGVIGGLMGFAIRERKIIMEILS
jgi:Family of unknown function (DUF5518)